MNLLRHEWWRAEFLLSWKFLPLLGLQRNLEEGYSSEELTVPTPDTGESQPPRDLSTSLLHRPHRLQWWRLLFSPLYLEVISCIGDRMCHFVETHDNYYQNDSGAGPIHSGGSPRTNHGSTSTDYSHADKPLAPTYLDLSLCIALDPGRQANARGRHHSVSWGTHHPGPYKLLRDTTKHPLL